MSTEQAAHPEVDMASGAPWRAPCPPTALLSNGRYTTLVTAAGTGFSALGPYALTRWQADPVEDADGFFLYLKDVETGRYWSAGHQPVQRPADRYAVRFGQGRAVLAREDEGIALTVEVCVAPTADAELRRCTVVNRSQHVRRLELTSYAEVVLHEPAADAAHPAFSKLFVQTEYVAARQALLARRRPRSPEEAPPWMAHWLVDAAAEAPGYETNRARFLGRGRTPAAPCALDEGTASGTTGDVLDPVMSLRRVFTLAPGAALTLTFGQGAAASREEVLALTQALATPEDVEGAFRGAAEMEAGRREVLGLSPRRVAYVQRLAGALLYGRPALRAAADVLARNTRSRADTASYRLPAGVPFVLARLSDADEFKMLRLLLDAQAYWRRLGLRVALLILNDKPLEAAEAFDEELAAVLGATRVSGPPSLRADVFLLHADDVPPDDQTYLQAAARVVVRGELPVLFAPEEPEAPAPVFQPVTPPWERAVREDVPDETGGEETLRFDNGYGGFNAEGDEYVVRVGPVGGEPLRLPPLPWVNVIANEAFGFIATERGAGYTWSVNSRENRLSPWYNDPVVDPHGEALYVRDEEAGVFWSPTPGPVPCAAAYEVRHGFGYTRFRHAHDELAQEVLQFVPTHDPVKITRVRITNEGARTRRLSFFTYQRLVLGVFPEESGRFVHTEYDADAAILLARNPDAGAFAGRVAFVAVVAPEAVRDDLRHTADREAFIGRYGNPARPRALSRPALLDGRTGAGFDPCAAFQVPLTLAPGQTITCDVLFGEADDDAHARDLVERYRAAGAVEAAFEGARHFWRETVGALQIETPVPEIDLMVNGWLVYQNMSCRLWGRSAYYQSGGAFGFRDQLQDASALVYVRPDLMRRQLLLHAAHQFVEGDVLHWWHPPQSQGIRTRFADDLLWLPYLTATYVRTTGDRGVLDETAPFLRARLLQPGEDEVFLTPWASGEEDTLYEHCCRALDRSLTRGAHGLPLMGTGDWNDGMNRVGRLGRGESVWIGFFLYDMLGDFDALCRERGDAARADRYAVYRAGLYDALNEAGWDGAWYRRAYYDDGTPLGSAENDECRIDALAQAWAVLSGAASPERAAQALDALEAHLVSEEEGLIRLLTPAFDQTPHDPGYIKGYLPGVRENGGQYTHAALWAVRALAEDGRRERAASLLAMLSPVSHGRTPEEVHVYQVEPYVVAADVYGVAPHVGRGGWTWYTGSAGWMYRVAVESILGLGVEDGKTLVLRPVVPAGWPGFRIRYRLFGEQTAYHIDVRNPEEGRAVVRVVVDGREAEVAEDAARIPLAHDGRVHRVEVVLG